MRAQRVREDMRSEGVNDAKRARVLVKSRIGELHKKNRT